MPSSSSIMSDEKYSSRIEEITSSHPLNGDASVVDSKHEKASKGLSSERLKRSSISIYQMIILISGRQSPHS